MWDESITRFVVSLWKDGLSGRQIGEKIGKTRSSVLGKLSRLGLLADGTHMPRVCNAPFVRKVQIARQVAPRKRRLARAATEAGREASSLDAPVPPPARPSTWLGIVGAVDGLGEDECRWPVSGNNDEPIGFCRAPTRVKQSYCPYHCYVSTKNASHSH